MFCPVDRKGHVWHTVRCLRCDKVFSVHWTLPVPRMPLCGQHRHKRLSAKERTMPLFPDAVLDLNADASLDEPLTVRR